MRADFVELPNRDLDELLHELWLELDALYGPNPGTEYTSEQLDNSGVYSFLVYDPDDVAVGCAALFPVTSSIVEIKRMYVRPAARGGGAAEVLLDELEMTAGKIGMTELRLETGVKQPRAIAFYERVGFEPCRCWGTHAADRQSRCFTKSTRRHHGPTDASVR